jgi:hypothetical protein
VGEVKAVADMHERKAEMARQSDAFIALPGECVCVTWEKESDESVVVTGKFGGVCNDRLLVEVLVKV